MNTKIDSFAGMTEAGFLVMFGRAPHVHDWRSPYVTAVDRAKANGTSVLDETREIHRQGREDAGLYEGVSAHHYICATCGEFSQPEISALD